VETPLEGRWDPKPLGGERFTGLGGGPARLTYIFPRGGGDGPARMRLGDPEGETLG
jgi:hypothetical protein